MKIKFIGWLAGTAAVMRRLPWAAILFLLGAWIFLDMGEGAFAVYAGVYLAIGTASMFVSSRKRRKNNPYRRT